MTSSILEGETIDKIRKRMQALQKISMPSLHVSEVVVSLLNDLTALLADRDTILDECEHLQAIFRDFLLDSEVARLAHEIGRNEGILEERLRLTGGKARTNPLSVDALMSGNTFTMQAAVAPIEIGQRMTIDSVTGLLVPTDSEEDTMGFAVSLPGEDGYLQVRIK
jgi:hypothetical protein